VTGSQPVTAEKPCAQHTIPPAAQLLLPVDWMHIHVMIAMIYGEGDLSVSTLSDVVEDGMIQ